MLGYIISYNISLVMRLSVEKVPLDASGSKNRPCSLDICGAVLSPLPITEALANRLGLRCHVRGRRRIALSSECVDGGL